MASNSQPTHESETYEVEDDLSTEYGQDSDYDSDSYGEDTNEDDLEDDFEALDVEDQVPLLPEEINAMDSVADHFESVFKQRFGSTHPSFFLGSLKEANRAAFRCPMADRRPLALYLHKDVNGLMKLPSETLVNKEISDLLRKEFVVWGWDMTTQVNRILLEELMAEADMRRIHSQIPSRLPALLVVLAPMSVNQIVARIQGHFSVERTTETLLDCLEQNKEIKEANQAGSAAFEAEKKERAALLEEQRIAYEHMLAEDKARQEEKLEKERLAKKKEDEERLQQEEEERMDA
ncbi:hypothetical protein L596_009881 [Steinernema carpocapsae]|uniref:UAS domain-containing protein n=1 Tax=Steinernema carpocapsae TaxID=34508 RepID=A0A4V6A6P6_STECR|nr:hypothetical protein L596_009881 [Steinernema carpocapsae]